MAGNRRADLARRFEVLRNLEPFDNEITKNRLQADELEEKIAEGDDSSPLIAALKIEWRHQLEDVRQRIIDLERRRSEIWESDRPDREEEPEPL
jgi:hypothetical protein